MDKFLELFKEGKESVTAAHSAAAVQLIETNKAKSVHIVLSRLRMPGTQLISHVRALSPSFTEAQLTWLRSVAPTEVDDPIPHRYTGDPDVLGKCEKFFLSIEPMRLLYPHLDFLILSNAARSVVVEVTMSATLIVGALAKIATSKRFRAVLTRFLRYGNIVNGRACSRVCDGRSIMIEGDSICYGWRIAKGEPLSAAQ